MYRDGHIIRRTAIYPSSDSIPPLTPQMELKLIQMWLHGKSGASRGIGAAIAKKMAELGANVTFTYSKSQEQA